MIQSCGCFFCLVSIEESLGNDARRAEAVLLEKAWRGAFPTGKTCQKSLENWGPECWFCSGKTLWMHSLYAAIVMNNLIFWNYCICCVSFCIKNKLDIWSFHSMVVICQSKSYKEPKPKTPYVRRVGFGDDLPSWLGLRDINNWKIVSLPSQKLNVFKDVYGQQNGDWASPLKGLCLKWIGSLACLKAV